MNRKFLLLFLILAFFSIKDVRSQGEANIWYFGNGAGLDFNNNPPTQLENGNASLGASNYEGVGSISDADGNLLFYTDGRSVFDKTHTAMPNGTGLLGGDGSSTQSGLCLPINGSTTQYFIISTNNGASSSYYSIVDITLNGGLGNVTTKNSALVAANCSEAVVSIPVYDAANNPTGENWIVFHDNNSNSYRVYKTNGATIIFSSTYSVGFTVPSQNALLLKTNGCFDKIAFSIYNSGRVELCPFNNVTGVISAPNLILNGTGAGNAFFNVEVFGIEFSPNEQFFYVTESGLNNRRTIFQFDITLGTGTNPAAVIASRSSFTGDATVERFGHLQLGPDGKIYCPGFTFSTPAFLSVVPTPNIAWTRPNASASDFIFKQYTYTAKRVGEGLPVFSQNLLRSIKIFYNNACEGGTTNFSYIFGGSAVSQSWDFGDPASGALNTSNSASPSHIYSTAGTYTATLTIVDNCGRTRTGTVDVIVKSGPTYSLPAVTCPNTNITITGTGTNAANYTWSASSTGSPVLGTGSSYIYNGSLPATIYVQDPTPIATHTVGNTTAGVNFSNDLGYTYFDINTSVRITSFQVITRLAAGNTANFSIQSADGATTYWGPVTCTSTGSGVTQTFNPNVTLTPGSYRFFTTNKDLCFRNNTDDDGNRDVNGLINVKGEINGTKGGSFINIGVSIPDPCGIRAIPIPLNCCVPPTITTQPSSQSVCVGTGVTFTVATSAGSPTYQWQVSTDNGGTWTNIGSATSASYSIPAASVTSSINNYQYRAVINPSGCFTNSNAATLTVKPIPSITNTPLATTVCEGTAWAGITITSDITAAYSWTSSASAGITGNTASGNTATIPSQTFANSGTTAGTVTYAITPTANGCSGTTTNYTVTVNPLPAITNTPLTATVCEGTAWAGITITSDVTGTTYNWTSSASAGITGNTASGNTATIPSQTFTNSGTTAGTVTYTITPTAGTCSSTPVNYVVTVNPTPQITNTPLTAAVCEGTAWAGTSITSDVAGTTFSWTSSASAGITGNTASGNTTTIPSQTFANSGTTAGTVTYAITPTANTCSSAPVNYVITVNPTPQITNTPLTAAVCEGTAWAGTTITSDVAGTTFSWTSSASVGITGNTASGNTATIPSQTFANSGTSNGTVTYAITPTAGTCSSAPVNYLVTVKPIPVITNSPLTATVCEGTAWAGLTITSDVAGTTYSWTSSASAGITGNTASGNTATIPSQTFTNSGTGVGTVTYTITPTANSCSNTPVNYIVTVNPATKITTQPVASTTLCAGDALNLNVAATGGSLTYQWNLNGSAISGAQSSTYNVASVALANAGNYTVTVTGSCGPLTSSIASVTINGVAISSQPANQGPCVGGNATFTVTASGPGLTYQWQENTGSGFSTIGGANSNSYTVNSVTAAMNNYQFRVMILSNGLCPVTSTTALLTVNTSTTINTQPASANLCLGDPLNLSVNASGSGTITYQWKLNGGAIGGATSSTYSVANIAVANAGNYTVDVSSSCGPATSAVAAITVNNVTITTQPVNTTACQGTTTSFSVSAAGLGVLSYQWQTDNGTGTFTDIASQTSATLNLNAVTLSMNGYKYLVIIKDDNRCSQTSSTVTLTVNPSTVITTQPAGTNLCAGDALNLNVVATGAGTLTYQWKFNSSNVGTNSSTYSVASVVGSNAGTYTVDVTGTCGTITSSNAIVTINGVTINTQPVNATACQGTNTSFSVSATGLGVLSYQWQTDNGTGTFTDIATQKSATLNLSSVTLAMNGYKYQVIIKDDNRCSQTSSAVTLTVNPSTVITTQPAGTNLCAGDALNLNVVATGAGTLTYQWKLNGSNVGANSSTYSVASVVASNAGTYTVDVTGTCGTITSSNTIVTINGVTINTQPVNATACQGTTTSFSVSAAGLGVLSYQWQTDNGTGTFTDIATQTSTTLNLNTVTMAMNGYKYQVIIKDNNRCSQTSSAVTLAVNPSTVISTQPTGASLCVGNTLNLGVTASGAGTLTYQWKLDGVPVGINSASYSVASVTTADAGTYTVDVTGSCGTLTSGNAVITVNGVSITTHPVSQTICENNDHTFTVTATGLGTLSYQWQTDNGTGIFNDISSATSSSYTVVAPAQSISGYGYRVIIKDNNVCPATSSAATLTVNPSTAITTNPAGGNFCVGSPLTLTVNATGTGMLSYQWLLNGNPISGATSNTYSVATMSAADAGSYTVDVTGNCTVTSTSATVLVNGVTLTSNPSNAIVCENTSTSFSVTASGLGTLSYQWQSDNGTGTFSDMTGETSSTLSLNNVPLNLTNSNYQVIVKDNNVCPVISTVASLTVNPLPTITTQPSDVQICENTNGTLSVVANNVTGYQWKFNGATITSANSSSFTITNANLSDAGVYAVEVSNACGMLASSNANVAVTPATISNLPVTGLNVCFGSNSTVIINNTQGHVQYQAFISTTAVSTSVQGTGTASPVTLTINAADLSAGNNTITVIGTGCDVATLSNTAQITVLANPGAITGTAPTICDNASTNLNYSIASVPGAAYYEWTLSNGSINSGQGTTNVNVNLGSSPTTITVKPYVSFPGGLSCNSSTYSVNQIVSYSGLDKLVIDEDSICSGNTITVSIADQSAESYTWGALPAGAAYVTQENTSRTISFGNSGTYVINVQPVHQCNPTITPLATDNLIIIEPPVANAGDDLELSKFESVILNGTGSSIGSVYAYEWTSNPASTIVNPQALTTSALPNALSTDYTLRVYTKNTKGCEVTDEMNVEVDFVVTIPNAFSPNGDGTHDVFIIQNIQFFPNSMLYIYNQWGELIYKSEAGYREAWDGTRNGNPVPVSAYYYVLEFNENNRKSVTGEINVIR